MHYCESSGKRSWYRCTCSMGDWLSVSLGSHVTDRQADRSQTAHDLDLRYMYEDLHPDNPALAMHRLLI